MADKGKEKGGVNTDPLMKVDAVALLKSIRDIEHQLSEYHRQDKVPKWGEELYMRLDKVENKRAESSQGSRESKSTTNVTLQDLTNDDRIVRKVRSDIDSDLQLIKSSCETKVSGLSLEVDRLHKLLASRPTNTELQQVVLSIQHVDSKINDTVNDITAGIDGIVAERVSTEMASLLKEIQANKDLNIDLVNSVSRKINSFSVDIGDMRTGIQQFQTSIQSQLGASEVAVANVRDDIATLQKSFDDDAEAVQKAFTEVKFSQTMASETFNEYKASMISKLLDTESDLRLQKSLLTDTVKSVETTQTTFTEKIKTLKANFEGLKEQFGIETTETKGKITEIVECITDLQERQTAIEDFTKQITDFKIFDAVNDIVSGLAEQEAKFIATDAAMKDISIENERLSALADATTAENADIKKTLIDHDELFVKLSEDDKRQDGAITTIDEGVQRIERELSRLSTVSGEITMLRDQFSTAEQRVKLNNKSVQELTATSSDHERRIEELVEILDKNAENEVKRMDELRGEMMDMLKQKQSEMEASLQNMKDNIEIISSAHQSLGGGAPRASRGNGNLSGRGVTNMGIGGAAGIAGLGGGGGAAAAGGGTGGAISDEEKEFNAGKAQFIADLGINFEAIAIKKTFVPEIPPAMREHLTAIGQEITLYIADVTDADMIQRQLQDTPDDTEFYTNIVTEMRSKKLEAFINGVREIIVHSNPQPGIIRHDARDKFLKLTKRAFELCMTKHNQVLNIGSSRLGRIKIPTCIACDRPLVEKARTDVMARSNNDVLLRASLTHLDDEDSTVGPQSQVKRMNMNRPQSTRGPQGSGSMLKMLSTGTVSAGRPTTAGADKDMSLTVGSHNNSSIVLKPVSKTSRSNNNVEVSKSYSILPDL